MSNQLPSAKEGMLTPYQLAEVCVRQLAKALGAELTTLTVTSESSSEVEEGDEVVAKVRFALSQRGMPFRCVFDFRMVAQGGVSQDAPPYVRCSRNAHDLRIEGDTYWVCWSTPRGPMLWLASREDIRASRWYVFTGNEQHKTIPMVFPGNGGMPLHPQTVPVTAGILH